MPLVFVVGFERCGTQTIAETLRAGCKVSGFIAHEDKPPLCEEVFAYTQGENWKTAAFLDRIDKFKWLSARLRVVCESNHRLGYFVTELNKLPGAKFILLVRDPVMTLVSRVANLGHYPEAIDRYPGFYREEIAKLEPVDRLFNTFRVRPKALDGPLHELYLGEWLINYQETITQLGEAQDVFFLQTEHIDNSVDKLLKFVGQDLFDRDKAAEVAVVRKDSVYTKASADVISFAKDTILPHADEIRKAIQQSFPDDPVIRRITGVSGG